MLFTVSALASGCGIVILSTQAHDLVFREPGFSGDMVDILFFVLLALIIVEAVIFTVFLRSSYRKDEFGKYSVQLILHGKLKMIFRAGVVLCGFILPFILVILHIVFRDAWVLLFVAGLLILLGRIALRWVLIFSGLKQLPPMLRTVDSLRRLNREST